MLLKISKMHRYFGVEQGRKCKDCNHLKRYSWNTSSGRKSCRKCEIYGDTDSEASDWCCKYDACGMWNKDYKGDTPIMKIREKVSVEQIEGQMRFEI